MQIIVIIYLLGNIYYTIFDSDNWLWIVFLANSMQDHADRIWENKIYDYQFIDRNNYLRFSN